MTKENIIWRHSVPKTARRSTTRIGAGGQPWSAERHSRGTQFQSFCSLSNCQKNAEAKTLNCYFDPALVLRTAILNCSNHCKSSSKAQIAAFLLEICAVAERGGLYCSIFRNSLRFCHFTRNTFIFCRLWPSLSSPMSLTSASQSLQWTSKVLQKSNMSNKTGFPRDNAKSLCLSCFFASERKSSRKALESADELLTSFWVFRWTLEPIEFVKHVNCFP